jgi:signal transduction histidine kinase
MVARSFVALSIVAAVVLLIRDAADGQSGRFGVELQMTLGLVVLGVAAACAPAVRVLVRVCVAVAASCVAVVGVIELVASVDRDGTILPAGTALVFACLGAGIATGQHRAVTMRWIADGLVVAAGAIAMFALVAVLFGSGVQSPIANRDPTTTVASGIGLLLSAAVLLRRTDHGLGKLFSSHTSGGVLARRLVPLLLVLPIGIARAAYLGVEGGAYGAGFATATGVIIGVAILIAAIVASADTVDRLDTVRRGNEAQIRQMVRDIANQSRELKRSNEELESFSYSVSHDLRAPIRHIAGFSELLAREIANHREDKTAHYLAMIAESAEQAGQLIDDLLEFSRMGRAEIHKREIAVDEIVQDAWTKLVPERAGRDIELRATGLETVIADPAMLELAISNLLSNAVKYTAGRSKADIDVDARRTGTEDIISIRDNGVGFNMKYADKLFGVFQRLHGDEFEGVGIGLANVKRIVERHGGRVWAEGEVDHGACFHLALPRQEPKDVRA